ncbi:MAG: CRISPR-associated protein Cas5 [Nitrososphaeraceae archaeon]
MQAVRLRVKGSFNSFRIYTSIRYHKTFHVPTKTTLISLLGAAIGWNEAEIESMYSRIRTNALLDRHNGTMTDLWSITKIKTDAPDKPESSLVSREMLFEPEYTIYYNISPNGNMRNMQYDDILLAFNDPAFPLTLGRSDEMIEILEKPKIIELISHAINEDHYYRNTILPFNYREYFDGYERKVVKQGYTFNLPQVLNIPTGFEINQTKIRKPSSYLVVTLVYDTAVKIINRCDGWLDNEDRRYLYLY